LDSLAAFAAIAAAALALARAYAFAAFSLPPFLAAASASFAAF